MQKAVPNSVKSAPKPCARVWEWEAIHSRSGVVCMGKIDANIGARKTGLGKCSVRSIAVRADVQGLAWRIVQIGGEFALPIGRAHLVVHSKDDGSRGFLLMRGFQEDCNR